MITFPTMLYKSPGKRRSKDGTYDYVGVNSQEEFDRKIADGWHPTRDAAFNALNKPKQTETVLEEKVVSDDLPTRAELEQKATELGLKFDGRTTDKKLLERIEQALGG